VKVKNSSIVKSAIMAVAVSLSAIPSFGQWATSGSNIYNTNSGNVGIGTSSPSYKLDIQRNGPYNQFRVRATGTGNNGEPLIKLSGLYNGGNGAELWQRTNGTFMLNTNGTTTAMAILADGRVGIGTTNAQATLDVSGSFRLGVGGGYGGLAYAIALTRTAGAMLADASGTALTLGGDDTGVDMTILANGYVGIGTTAPSSRLAVNGTIRAREVIVTTQGWPDHVLKPDYNLKPLHEVEKYIKKNSRLEGIPSEKEVMTTGVPMGEMQAKLLQKLEETTLYLIEMKKENEALKARLAAIEQKVR
jgi:hypothetical protein